MHLFVLDSCKIYAQLLPEIKNVRPSEGFKIIRIKAIRKSPPTHLSVSSSGVRSRVRNIYLWKAICALKSPVRLLGSKGYPQNVPPPPGEERASAFLVPKELG